MKAIQLQYSIKDIGAPKYYLGLDYQRNSRGKWSVGCKRYISNAIEKVEATHGKITARNNGTPLATKDHPETDKTLLLDDKRQQQFQQLIGMLNWIVQLGRFDVAFATASLSRFSAAPQEGHMDQAIKVFGYLKNKATLLT